LLDASIPAVAKGNVGKAGLKERGKKNREDQVGNLITQLRHVVVADLRALLGIRN
jgi:hypothetical protein